MDYSAFKAKAVVDWIDVEITTATPTQRQWIQRDLRRILNLPEHARDIWVEPVTPGAGDTSRVFRVRFHDAPANRYMELKRIMDALADRKPFAAPPKVHTIEIAADFYAKGQASIPVLADLTKQLQAGIALDRGQRQSSNPRQFDLTIGGSKGRNVYLAERFLGVDKEGNDYWSAPDRSEVDPNLSLYLANKPDKHQGRQGTNGGGINWQVYFKRTDEGGIPLPADEQRARAEFTLRGVELTGRGITDVGSLKGFRFEILADLLRFRRMKPLEEVVEGMNPFAAYAVRHLWRSSNGIVATWPLGLRAYRKDRRTGQPRTPVDRKHSIHTAAEDDLNRTVRRSLDALSDRFSSPNRAKKSSDSTKV